MATNNSINAPFPFTVVQGGTGVITLTTAYGTLCAGTTATGAIQTVSPGTSGHVLTSTGASSLPSYQAPIIGFPWTEVTGTSQAMAVNNAYIANNAGLVTLTIPTTAAVGQTVIVVGKGAGGWSIAQNASENIRFGNVVTTTGVGGSLSSSNQYDSVELVCIVADTTWTVRNVLGNVTYV